LGEIDWTGRISKWGDAMLRSYLSEAANVLLTRIEVVLNDSSPIDRLAAQTENVPPGQSLQPEATGAVMVTKK